MILERVQGIIKRNTIVKRDVDNCFVSAEKNKVNLNAWINPNSKKQNVGDWLSEVIVENVAAYYDIPLEKPVSRTKHLYALGSILLGYQDATVWGSGFLNDATTSRWFFLYKLLHRYYHSTDVRAVRGPETRRILQKIGISCPEVYGDPAILMPMFYQPCISRKIPYVIVPHFNETQYYKEYHHVLETFTSDYRQFIESICSADLVISSSLHGIILAESYGVPAILLQNHATNNLLKYKDYYYSTGRKVFPIAKSVEEALTMLPPSIPDFSQMQRNLLESFPVDLWE